MRLNQFRFLIGLEKYKTFSKTAEELLVAQPSISQAIKELEEELGYKLLLRDGKQVSFTAKGLWVLEKAHIIIDAFQEIENSKLFIGSADSFINVACPPYFNQILLEIVLRLQPMFPKQTIQLLEFDTLAIIDKVSHEELTLGLIQITENDSMILKKIAQNKLTYVPLCDSYMCFLARAGHSLKEKSSATLKEIFSFPYVTYKEYLLPTTLSLLQASQYQGRIMQISNFETLKNYIASSDAVTLCPAVAFYQENMSEERFSSVQISDYHWTLQIGLVYRTLSEKLQPFVDEFILRYQAFVQQ